MQLAQAYIRGDLEVPDEELPKLLGAVLPLLQAQNYAETFEKKLLFGIEFIPVGLWRDLLIVPAIYDTVRMYSVGIRKLLQDLATDAHVAMVNSKIPFARNLLEKLNIAFHYNLPQSVYDLMLGDQESDGRETAYTCGYFGDPTKIRRSADEQEVQLMTLTNGQENKFELNARKLGLHRPAQEGEKEKLDILDVGCGVASEIIYYVTHFRDRIGKVVGITLSERQLEEGQRKIDELEIGDVVELRLQNYRDLDETDKFDRVLSVGMAEAVGIDSLADYAGKISKVLADDGKGLIHLITTNRGVPGTPGEAMKNNSSFIASSIFPGGQLPTIAQMKKAMEDAGLTIEHEHQFGFYYYETALRWFKNWCDRESEVIEALQKDGGLSQKKAVKKHREYKLYLAGVSQMFLQRVIDLTQFVINKNDLSKDDTTMEAWMA